MYIILAYFGYIWSIIHGDFINFNIKGEEYVIAIFIFANCQIIPIPRTYLICNIAAALILLKIITIISCWISCHELVGKVWSYVRTLPEIPHKTVVFLRLIKLSRFNCIQRFIWAFLGTGGDINSHSVRHCGVLRLMPSQKTVINTCINVLDTVSNCATCRNVCHWRVLKVIDICIWFINVVIIFVIWLRVCSWIFRYCKETEGKLELFNCLCLDPFSIVKASNVFFIFDCKWLEIKL